MASTPKDPPQSHPHQRIMKNSVDKFSGVQPYASELFGVYQPLLGWKSRMIKRRLRNIPPAFKYELVPHIKTKVFPRVRVVQSGAALKFEELEAATTTLNKRSGVIDQIDGLFARSTLAKIQELGPGGNEVWDQVLSDGAIKERMEEVGRTILGIPDPIPLAGIDGSQADPEGTDNAQAALADIDAVKTAAEKESVIAGTLGYMAKNKMYSTLKELFYPSSNNIDLPAYLDMKRFLDPLETFDPKTDLDIVALSPVGIVHLFKQYFFEFDTFLGSPIQHIWLSPGSTVELVEISTRKITTERFVESAFESVSKSEKSLTESDELSDAVRTENQNSTKFGVGISLSGGVNTGIYTLSANATTNYNVDTSEKESRESLHKQTRQQSSKLSTEIRENFKTTFKTTTEVMDTTSKRYVLQNSSQSLLNYELRRKMRKVGVQLQDIGTQLCWHAYVDVPGDALGISKLIHIAEPADLSNLQQPEALTLLKPQKTDITVSFPYESTSGTSEKDVVFYFGNDREGGPFSNNDRIVWVRDYTADPPDHGYVLDKNITLTPQHSGTCAAEANLKDNKKGVFEIRLNQVNFDDKNEIIIKVTLRWNPPDQSAAQAKFLEDQVKYDREKERLTKEAYVKAARERVKLASNIESRRFDELREEERIVIYRSLIGQLLNVGVSLENKETRHVASELIDSMFDTEKMLYFVSPEWWRPRVRRGEQTFGSKSTNGVISDKTPVTSENVVSWGGAGANREDNYWITEDSKPAKLGSSLGWILQLDGDNMRNAFLNSPWVKAVIPIRPGKERAAINWMTHVSVEGTDGIGSKYQFSSSDEATKMVTYLKAYKWSDPEDKARYGPDFNADKVTMKDALTFLSILVAEKNKKSNEKQTTTIGDTTISYLPTDLVYERGFYPLKGGFKSSSDKPFEVFDQWTEILPTDQIVPVEVKYDPKTGNQI